MIGLITIVAVSTLFIVFGLLNRGETRVSRCTGCPGPDNPTSCGNCGLAHDATESHHVSV